MNFDEKVAYLRLYFEYLEKTGRTSGVLKKMQADFVLAVDTVNEKLLNLVFKEAQKRVRDTFSQHEKNVLQEQYESSLLISKVLETGRIESVEEYELLLNKVEKLINDSKINEELMQCNKLLAEYDQSAKSKG